MFWSKGSLISPKVTGTTSAGKPWHVDLIEQGKKKEQNSFLHLHRALEFMYVLRFIVLTYVAVVASPFMERLKELRSKLAQLSQGTSAVDYMLRSAQLIPSLMTLGMAVWCLKGWWLQLFDNAAELAKWIRWLLFACIVVPMLTLALASAYGLWPVNNCMLDPRKVEEHSLVEAALWGGCGFISILLSLAQVVQDSFRVEQEITMLRIVGDLEVESNRKRSSIAAHRSGIMAHMISRVSGRSSMQLE